MHVTLGQSAEGIEYILLAYSERLGGGPAHDKLGDHAPRGNRCGAGVCPEAGIDHAVVLEPEPHADAIALRGDDLAVAVCVGHAAETTGGEDVVNNGIRVDASQGSDYARLMAVGFCGHVSPSC